MSSLINRAACKKALLECSKATRNGKFTRVSADVFEHLEVMMLNYLKGMVRQHPSLGKTIMMESKKRQGHNVDDNCQEASL